MEGENSFLKTNKVDKHELEEAKRNRLMTEEEEGMIGISSSSSMHVAASARGTKLSRKNRLIFQGKGD